MKKTNYKIKLHFTILYILLTILIVINIISNKNIIIGNQTQIIKTMDKTTEISNLNNTINTLQESHLDYSNYIQTNKSNLAQLITNAGLQTNETDSLETMVSNVSNILSQNSSKLFFYEPIYASGVRLVGTATIQCTKGDILMIESGSGTGGACTIKTLTNATIIETKKYTIKTNSGTNSTPTFTHVRVNETGPITVSHTDDWTTLTVYKMYEYSPNN